MTNQKDIAKKQAEIVGQLQQFPIGRTNSGGRAGGTVEVVVTNPLPGQPSVVQAKCANDCPPGDVQLIKSDDGSYTALSPNAATKNSETTTRQVSKKDPKKPQKDEEIWAGTVCLLFSRLQQETVDLTDRGLATGEETSWDWTRIPAWSSSNINSKAYVFAKRKDTLGDYLTGEDALNNVLKPDRLIPAGGSGSSGAAKDNLVAGANSQDAVTVWFYIGELQGSGTDLVQSGTGQIFKVSGVSIYPSNENTEQGPGFCMEMYRQGSISAGLYPIVQIGKEPLSQYLSSSFPDLGGKIGYWGNIYTWHGMQDYTTGGSRRTFLYREYWSGIGGVPAYPTETPETPTSFPPEWQTGVSNYSPWTQEDSGWYRFGWEYQDNRIGCMSAGAIGVVNSELTNSGFLCGSSVPNDKWYWVGGVGSSAGALDKRAYYSSASGMFVCWQGHKDHIGMAQSFFEAFRTYWKIPGIVTKLRSCNPFGCELPGDGGGYPPPPPDAPAQRFLSRYYGRLADIILQVHRRDDELVQLKLPVEFAACIERREVLGGGSYGFGANYESYKTANYTRTYSQMIYYEDPFCLELVHATMSMDKDYAYIDVFGGGDRTWEEPLTNPIPNRLGQLGFGGSGADSAERRISVNPNATFSTNPAPSTDETKPRLVKDCFGFVHSFVVKLPTNEEKTLTIVSYQKYKRGQNISLTAANPESEFGQKRYLIFDYRTEVKLEVQNSGVYVTTPNNEFTSFNGLPALVQVPNYSPSAMGVFQKKFYKEQIHWTEMDWLYWQLQEGPRQFNPANTVLPPGVKVDNSGTATGVFFEFDKKFGRHARAECIIPAASFGYAGTYSGGISPQYSNDVKYFGKYILFTSFSEQLRGNGLKENGILTKWYRISTSSFPVHGQLKRNTN